MEGILDLKYGTGNEQEKQKYLESIVTKNETLQENLINQLHLNTSDEEKIRIGESIIGNINIMKNMSAFL